MRLSAGEVGRQAGALYNYIPDKQTLLFGLMQRHMEQLLEARAGERAALGAGIGALARLEAFTRFHIAFHLERPDEVFISYMELRNLTDENFAEIERLRRLYEDELEGILRDGIASGEVALADPKLATLAVIAMLTGVTTWYRPAGRLSPEGVAEIYWDMVRRAVSA